MFIGLIAPTSSNKCRNALCDILCVSVWETTDLSPIFSVINSRIFRPQVTTKYTKTPTCTLDCAWPRAPRKIGRQPGLWAQWPDPL